MRVLITGMNGFTGLYLKDTLERLGHEVFNLTANINDLDAVKTEICTIKPELIAHLAAISYVGHSNIQDIYNTNLIGTLNLLTALEKHSSSIKAILLASTANIYENNNTTPISEGNPAVPINDYGVSKLSMEYMSKLWMDRLPIFIVRPFNYTGVGQNKKFLIPKIVSTFKDKKNYIELGNLDIVREFNDVRFVSDVYSKLLENPPYGEVINISTGVGYSLLDIIEKCIKLSGHNIEIKTNKKFVRNNELKFLVGDDSKLKKHLNQYQTFHLDQTLNWMLGY